MHQVCQCDETSLAVPMYVRTNVYTCIHTSAYKCTVHKAAWVYIHAVLLLLCLWRVMKGKLWYVCISVWGVMAGISSALLLTGIQ